MRRYQTVFEDRQLLIERDSLIPLRGDLTVETETAEAFVGLLRANDVPALIPIELIERFVMQFFTILSLISN
jgi:hypothetical protein